MDVSTSDLVVLYLSAVETGDASSNDPATVAGITDALELGTETLADRVETLSSLDDLRSEGLIETTTTSDDETTRYALTDTGRTRAASLRDALADETVTVESGTAENGTVESGTAENGTVESGTAENGTVESGKKENVPVTALDEYLPEPALVRGLARRSDDDVVYLERDVDDEFVGRSEELDAIRSLADAVESDEDVGVAFVTGEPGIGKTELLEAITRRYADRGYATYTGQCQRGPTDAYQPLQRTLADRYDDDRESPFERVADDVADSAVDDADALAATRRRLFADVADDLAAEATDAPFLVAIDDLHLGDDLAWESLGTLVEFLADAPVLLVVTARPRPRTAETDADGDAEAGRDGDGDAAVNVAGDVAATFDGTIAPQCCDDHVRRLRLRAFGREPTERVVQGIVGRRDVPASFVDAVYDRTGGDPLSTIETVTWLLENDHVIPDHEVYPETIDDAAIPGEVKATVASRLDVLDDHGRTVVEYAAVAGDHLDARVLADAADLSLTTVREYVAVLVDVGVLTRPDDDEIAFANGLLRDAILDDLPTDRLQALHCDVATALQDATAGDDPERDRRIAHHYDEGGRSEHALEYYRRAGREARAVYAHESAATAFERALAIAREHGYGDVVLSTLEALGEIKYVTGEYDDAIQYFEYFTERVDDVEPRRRALRYRAKIHHQQGDFERAKELADAGLELGENLDSTEGCRLLGSRGGAQIRLGELDAAREDFERERSIAAGLDDEHVARAYNHLGNLEAINGNIEDARDAMETAVSLAEETGAEHLLGKALTNLGTVHNQMGNADAATEARSRALDVRRRIGDYGGEPSTLVGLGIGAEFENDRERALERYEDALAAARVVGDRQSAGLALGNVGNLHFERGELDVAIDYLERCIDAQRELGDRRLEAGFEAHLALARTYHGELDAARATAEHALDIASEDGFVTEELEARAALGCKHRARLEIATAGGPATLEDPPDGSTFETARETLATGAALGSEAGLPEYEHECRVELAVLHAKYGNTERAAEQFESIADLQATADLPGASASLARSRLEGLLAADRGDYDVAVDELQAGIETAAAARKRLEELELRVDLADVHTDRVTTSDEDDARGGPAVEVARGESDVLEEASFEDLPADWTAPDEPSVRVPWERVRVLASELDAGLFERTAGRALEAVADGP